MFKACIPLSSREDEEIYKGLDVVLRHYNKGGYTVTNDELDIDVNIANPEEHVGDVERLNRKIQEKFRTKYYHLPFKAMPEVIINDLACFTTKAMNLFPVKGGVSSYFSPHVM